MKDQSVMKLISNQAKASPSVWTKHNTKSSNGLWARAQSILTIESNAGPDLATFSAVMLSPQLHDAEASMAMHAYLEQWDIQTSIDCFTAESTRWIAHQDASVAELSTHSVAVELSEVLRGSS